MLETSLSFETESATRTSTDPSAWSYGAFLSRDAIRKRGLCCRPVSVCLSVCLSVTLVCIQTAEDIVKLLSRPGSERIILTFWPRAPIPNFKGKPFSEGATYTAVGKFVIFDWNRRLYRKRYEIGPRLLWTLMANHMWRIDTCRFRWPWVTLTRVSRSLYSYKSNISKTVLLRDKVTIEH